MSYPLNHLGEPCGLDRFQQVVDGADLERFDRVLIERGDEHDVALHAAFQQLARHLEPGQPRHLDIEEDHVRRQRFRQRDRLEPVGRLVDNLDVVELPELKRQLAAGRLLVVGDQDPQGHSIKTGDRAPKIRRLIPCLTSSDVTLRRCTRRLLKNTAKPSRLLLPPVSFKGSLR